MENEAFEFESLPPELLESGTWDGELSFDLVPMSQSAPPQASGGEGFEELPEFPPRLPRAGGHASRPAANGRVRGKAFFLTYSQSRLARERITQWFARQPRLRRLVVGQEHHLDGNLHWHVAIEYEVEKDVRTGSYFNLDGEHPNIKVWTRAGGSTYDQWFLNHWNYCKKEDPTPFIVGEEPKDSRKRKRDEISREAMLICRSTGVNEAMKFLEDNASYDFLTKSDQMYRCMMRIRNLSRPSHPARPLSDFRYAPRIVEDWHCLFLNGPTRFGKTAFARALLPEATVVSHRDQLRDVDFSKGVIFDDFDVGHWPPTAVIHLLDWDEYRGIDVKHGHVVIPPHTKKIFTNNCSFERWVSKDATEEQIAACRRRVHVINVNSPLFEARDE